MKRTPVRSHLVGLTAALALGGATLLAGCSSLLEQNAPSQIQATNLEGPESASLLVDGAKAAFGCAFQAHIMGFGLLTDELDDAQLAAAAWDWDRRSWLQSGGNFASATCDGGQQFGNYTPLHTARFMGDLATSKLASFTDDQVPNRISLQATAEAYAAYSYLLLGEGFCSMAIDGGPEIQPKDVFALAETRFTDAMTHAQTAGNTDILHMAQLGRARTRLDLATLPGATRDDAKLADAKADAQAIPAGFNYQIPYNAASTYAQNNVAVRISLNHLFTVGTRYRDMTFGGVADPRVVITTDNPISKGQDASTLMYYPAKYLDRPDPISLAKYQEAQLIIAEAEYYTNPQTTVGIINQLHDAVGLPHFTSNDPTEIFNQLVEERSRELFLESQRGYDFTRLNLPFDPPAGAAYKRGGNYGSVRCLPLPDVERVNNPNFAKAR
jgi:hypothetical protein